MLILLTIQVASKAKDHISLITLAFAKSSGGFLQGSE